LHLFEQQWSHIECIIGAAFKVAENFQVLFLLVALFAEMCLHDICVCKRLNIHTISHQPHYHPSCSCYLIECEYCNLDCQPTR